MRVVKGVWGSPARDSDRVEGRVEGSKVGTLLRVWARSNYIPITLPQGTTSSIKYSNTETLNRECKQQQLTTKAKSHEYSRLTSRRINITRRAPEYYQDTGYQPV